MEMALLDCMPDAMFEDFAKKYAELFIKGGVVKSAGKTSEQLNVTFTIGEKELYVSMLLWDSSTGNKSKSGTV